MSYLQQSARKRTQYPQPSFERDVPVPDQAPCGEEERDFEEHVEDADVEPARELWIAISVVSVSFP